MDIRIKAKENEVSAKDILLNNGFSIIRYSHSIDFIIAEKTV